MKNLCLAIAISLSLTGARGQDSQPGGATAGTTDSAVYLSGERGPNHHVVHRITTSTNDFGEVLVSTNSYEEIATGLSYWDPVNGQWKESREEIESFPDGAIARQGQHKVIFANDLATIGAIDMEMPGGQRLQSHLLGLSYQDVVTGSNTLIAEVKGSVPGVILPPNKVLYADAFTDFEADVVYTYTRAGFEQDIILRERPPLPESFGLNSASSVLQVLTEFQSAPAPGIRTSIIPGDMQLPDQTLDFGVMRIGAGKAFSVGENPIDGVSVSKEWATLEGRTFLVEQVSIPAIAEGLDELPLPQESRANPGSGSKRRSASLKRTLPDAPQMAKTGKSEMKTASLSLPSKGFVLDYTTVLSTQTNYVFKGNLTYHLTGDVILTGTNSTFEGGTVLKYDTNVTLTVNTPVTWLGSSYRPVIMVSKDDTSVGQSISGASGTPTNYLASRALYFDATTANTNLVIQNLRVSQALKAIAINGGSGHVLQHIQLVTCSNGVALTSTDVSLRNALFDDVYWCFTGSSGTARVEHLTVDTFDKNYGPPNSINLSMTNSLIVGTGLLRTFTSVNNVTNNTGSGGIFESVGSGYRYLVANSTNRNAGSTNINSDLLKDLKRMTTYPPVIRSNLLISASTNWAIQAPRNAGQPDIGYHYWPIDYLCNGVTVSNATLTLNGGVAVGCYGLQGIWLEIGGKLVSGGTAETHNQLFPYQLVQEQPVTLNSSPFSLMLFTSGSVEAKFTDFHGMSAAGIFLTYGDGPCQLKLKDCFLGYGASYVQSPSGGASVPTTFTNNLFERADLTIGTFDYENPVFFYNNTVRNSTIEIEDGWSVPNYRTIRDNLFDNSTLTVPNPSQVYFDHNAYYQSTTTLTNHTGDFTVTSLSYATGPLGNRYVDSATPTLVDAGSRLASDAGLYHYTTKTNQIKEGEEAASPKTVDIGFHYVAASGNKPIDSDGDGIPDHLEDTDGDGISDSNETDWQNPCFPAVDVVLVIDRSGSMNDELESGLTRFVAAKKAATNFINRLTANVDHVALVSFCGDVDLNEPLTTNFPSVLAAVGDLEMDPDTRIDFGITEAHAELTSIRHNPLALPVMVVLTDGENYPTNTRPLVPIAADAAKAAGIRLVTIALGTGADTDLLSEIASTPTANNYYFATNSSQLNTAYGLIASSICRSNRFPVVNIINPTNLEAFDEGADVTITAVAYDPDPDGSITNIMFYSTGTELPYTITSSQTTNFYITWPEPEVGFHPITAVAKDNMGGTQTSSITVFEVVATNPPVITITSPSDGETFYAGAEITIKAATNGVGVITNVLFFVNGQLLGADPDSPYTITKCCWESGEFNLLAQATDSQGVKYVSSPIVITVGDRKPTSGNGEWDPQFGNPGSTTFYPITALKTHGNSVYAGGWSPVEINGVASDGIIKWDGTNWSVFTEDLPVIVHAIAFDDSTNIYVGGDTANSELRNIAAWDGTTWIHLGSNSLHDSEGFPATIWAVEILGSDIYIGGNFTSTDTDTNVQYIAKLNQSNWLWESVGNGLNGPVHALAQIGGKLYAGGRFTDAGGDTNANYVALLDANVWKSLGAGVDGTNSWGEPGAVYCLTACDKDLFVGGEFTSAGGNTNANGIAKYQHLRL
jgi:Mg-chelatase subunit ChlD